MIALTARLNERDDTIVNLQEELDAYDRVYKETEEVIQSNNFRLQELENLLQENNIPIPKETRMKTEIVNFIYLYIKWL